MGVNLMSTNDHLYTVTFWKIVPGTKYAQETGTIVQQSVLQHDVYAKNASRAKSSAIKNCETELSAINWDSVTAKKS